MGGRSGHVITILGPEVEPKSKDGPNRLSVALPDGNDTFTGIFLGLKVPEFLIRKGIIGPLYELTCDYSFQIFFSGCCIVGYVFLFDLEALCSPVATQKDFI